MTVLRYLYLDILLYIATVLGSHYKEHPLDVGIKHSAYKNYPGCDGYRYAHSTGKEGQSAEIATYSNNLIPAGPPHTCNL